MKLLLGYTKTKSCSENKVLLNILEKQQSNFGGGNMFKYSKFIKTTFTTALASLMIISGASGFASVSFKDMPAVGNWARVPMERALENGLITGAGEFLMPNGVVTRAQMAAIVNKAFGAKELADLKKFIDVPKDAWYYADMAKAVKLGIFNGSGNKLDPTVNITREQVCVVLANAFNLKPMNDYALNAFSDSKTVSAYALEGVQAMVSAGYLNGSNGQIKPKANITRAELLAIMNNIVKTYINAAGEYDGVFDGNVMVNAPGVKFMNANIKGDLFIGSGIGSEDIDLGNLIVSGRIIIKGSELIAELELIDEEIALGGGIITPTPNPGTTTPVTPPITPPADDTVTKLQSVNSKLVTRVMPLLETDVQKEATRLVMTSIENYIKDKSYDISNDVAAAKVLGLQMTAEEYAFFKNSITGNIPISELVTLNNYFKVIEY